MYINYSYIINNSIPNYYFFNLMLLIIQYSFHLGKKCLYILIIYITRK